MTTTQLINAAYLKATGKVATFASGSTKWNKLLGIANFYIDNWENEPGVDWQSLYDPAYELGTITATDTYELDSDIRKVSQTQGDTIRVYYDGSTTRYTEYDLVNAKDLKSYDTGAYCAIVGRTIMFNTAFTSSMPQFGGDLVVPVYTYAPDLVRASDTVPVDNPNWLVLMCAAEYIRNDITRQQQYGNLITEANQAMQRMIQDNVGQIDLIEQPWSPTDNRDIWGY